MMDRTHLHLLSGNIPGESGLRSKAGGGSAPFS